MQVRGIDRATLCYGGRTSPAGESAELAGTRWCYRTAPSSPCSDRVGDELQLGEASGSSSADDHRHGPGRRRRSRARSARARLRPARFSRRDEALAFGSRARFEAALRLPTGADADRIASRLRAPLSAERASVRTVSEDQKRLSESLTRFGNFLALVALVALLLGGLGVASAVHVFIKRRMTTIAVLRCLGASAGVLLAAYLLQAMVVGLLGSLLGAALGAAVQLLLPLLLADVLPVDVAWSLSWRSVGGGVAVGVWVAVVFALLPILGVRDVSPLAVLRRDYEETRPRRRDPLRLLAALALAASLAGLSVVEAGRVAAGLAFALGVAVALALLALSALLLVRGLRRFFPSGLPYLYRQGLANLYRPANQTLMVVLALGFGVFLLSTLLLVQHNLLRDLRVDRGESRPNLAFFDVQPDQREDVEAARAGSRAADLARRPHRTDAHPVAEGPARLRAALDRGRQAAPGKMGAPARVPQQLSRRARRGGEGRGRRVVAARRVEGTRRRGGEAVPIALEANLARELRLAVGDEVAWDVQGVTVRSRVAALRDVQWVRFSPNFFVVFPEGPLDAAPKTLRRPRAGRGRGAPRSRCSAGRGGAPERVDARPERRSSGRSSRCSTRSCSACASWRSSASPPAPLVLAGAVASSRQQRVREGALLRTLGATRSQLVRILLAEYVVLGALAAATAILLSTVAAWALVRFVFEGSFALPGPSLLAARPRYRRR